MKTTVKLFWKCSASRFTVEIPVGAEIEQIDNTYYISPRTFKANSIERHDAEHYGIRIFDCKTRELKA